MFLGKGFTRRLAVPAISAALFLMMGGHWVILQTVAWTKMVMDYSRQTSVQQALRETFDGEHPCDMCKKISRARNEPNKSVTAVAFPHKDLSFVTARVLQVTPPKGSEFEYPPFPWDAWSGPVVDLPTPIPIS